MIGRNPDSLRRRRLLPAGGVALAAAAFGDVVLDSAVVFAVGLIAAVAVAGLMALVLCLECPPEDADVTEASVFSGRGEAS